MHPQIHAMESRKSVYGGFNSKLLPFASGN